VLGDVRRDLCSPYNVTQTLCKRIADDKERKPCDAEGRHNQSKSSKESCVDVKELLGADETIEREALVAVYKQSKFNCQHLNDCFGCIKASLRASDDYESTMRHAIAVNFTIIDFQVWNYFRISSRVHELVSEGNKLLRAAVEDCQIRQECVDVDGEWRAALIWLIDICGIINDIFWLEINKLESLVRYMRLRRIFFLEIIQNKRVDCISTTIDVTERLFTYANKIRSARGGRESEDVSILRVFRSRIDEEEGGCHGTKRKSEFLGRLRVRRLTSGEDVAVETFYERVSL
jgi:hypothetical protein